MVALALVHDRDAPTSACEYCDAQVPFYRQAVQDKTGYLTYKKTGLHMGYIPCGNFDSELRFAGERGLFVYYAWLPVRCRNGKLRWLRWVARHSDGTVTLAGPA